MEKLVAQVLIKTGLSVNSEQERGDGDLCNQLWPKAKGRGQGRAQGVRVHGV